MADDLHCGACRHATSQEIGHCCIAGIVEEIPSSFPTDGSHVAPPGARPRFLEVAEPGGELRGPATCLTAWAMEKKWAPTPLLKVELAAHDIETGTIKRQLMYIARLAFLGRPLDAAALEV